MPLAACLVMVAALGRVGSGDRRAPFLRLPDIFFIEHCQIFELICILVT